MKQEKQFNFKYILVSALYIVLGLVLLLWPDLSVRMICFLLSAVMFVIGLAYIILFFTKDKEDMQGFLQMDLVIGIVAVAFGAFVFFNQKAVATMLPFVMGIVFLLGALIKLQNALTMRRLLFSRWFVVLIFALVMAGVGAVALANPFSTEHNFLIFIGICLITDGLVNLISMGLIVNRLKKLKKMQAEHPDRVITPDDLLADRMKKAPAQFIEMEKTPPVYKEEGDSDHEQEEENE